MRVTYSRGRGEDSGGRRAVSWNYGTETDNSQVGVGPLVEAGYTGKETGNSQLGGGPLVGAGVGTISGFGLGVEDRYDGHGSGYQEEGGCKEVEKVEVKIYLTIRNRV